MTNDWRAGIVPEAENERRVCAECGAVWILTAKARDWFTAKRLMIPKRCEACRLARRQRAREAV